jgi:hypothetical protein
MLAPSVLFRPVLQNFMGVFYIGSAERTIKLSGMENKSPGRQLDKFIATCLFLCRSTAITHSVCVCVISRKDCFKIPVRPKQERTRTSYRSYGTVALPDIVTARACYLAMMRSLRIQNLNY